MEYTLSAASESSTGYYAAICPNNDEALFQAAMQARMLMEVCVGSITYRDQLDNLYQRAKENNKGAIELLTSLVMGEGEISAYAQQRFCQIVCRDDGVDYETAAAVRARCQELITQPDYELDNRLASLPKLVFAASTLIEGDGENNDVVPVMVKQIAELLSEQLITPKWFQLHAGVFKAMSYEAFTDADKWLRVTLPGDGACQFRAALLIESPNAFFLRCSTDEILAELIASGKDEKIKQAIGNAVDSVQEMGVIPASYDAFFKETQCVDTIYNLTILNGHFTLFLPEGIGQAIDSYLALQLGENGEPAVNDDESEMGSVFIIHSHPVAPIRTNSEENLFATFLTEEIDPMADPLSEMLFQECGLLGEEELAAYEDIDRMGFLHLFSDAIGESLFELLKMKRDNDTFLRAEHVGIHYNILVLAEAQDVIDQLTSLPTLPPALHHQSSYRLHLKTVPSA